MTPGKGSKYREFYDLSGRITCMSETRMLVFSRRGSYGYLPSKISQQLQLRNDFSARLHLGGSAVAWWLMPWTPDPEVGGFEPHSGQTVLCT